ncbi:MAG TPA: sulfate ABC transporter ATP-binding protein [Alphaproteobacteria bacterium]|jgi:sulfate transport system ATP-binding protein|nr:sulfate ABC transporter ATP-binding protein [Micavibrio sp.]MBK9561990.1 sulfate ABC transporter ATP-binding protein [Micavibrio sp.]HQX26414.1 sulfate ABC transporter ATP-binding protein [Alphaproteobacteria bacterium]
MGIRADNIYKIFRDFMALDGVSLNVGTGELVALLGPSGSGKTTLLRIIAGLEFADLGEIYIDREEASHTPVKERRVGFVFQHYALFRHMTVFENIAFGLRVRPKESRPSEGEIRKKVMKLIDLIHLSGLHNRYPAQLSGGQRQRVALARTLAVDPKVLLLDEPFGALDAKVRKELRRWLRKIHDELNITTIFVTHDQEEALELADRVVVMNSGKIEQVGSPEDVYHNPANAFVYDFLGNYNAFDGFVGEDGECRLLKNGEKLPAGTERVRLFARPHDMEITPQPQDKNAIPARIIHINPAGPMVSIELENEQGKLLQAAVTKERFMELGLEKRQTVYLKARDMRLFN